MKKNIPLFIFFICILLLNITLIYNIFITKNNKDNYFRLHVVANSNSIDDQIIKLNISKKITNYLNSLYNSSNVNIIDKASTKAIIKENIYNILDLTKNELNLYNTDYDCYANIGELSYSKKYSDAINMKAGTYDSVQIVLGEGKGQNFWSLIFPYSYNPEFNINTQLDLKSIEIKSGIFENIKRVAKFLS